MKIKHFNPQKAHPWRKTRLLSVERYVTIHPPARSTCRRAEENKKERKEGRKEGRKTTKIVANWLFAQTTHVVGSKSNLLCMVGGLRCVVIHVKCDPNRLRGYGAVGGGSKMALPHYFGQWLIQKLVLPYKP